MSVINLEKIICITLFSSYLWLSLTLAQFTPDNIMQQLNDQQQKSWEKVTEFYNKLVDTTVTNHQVPFARLNRDHTFQFWQKGAEPYAVKSNFAITGYRKEVYDWEYKILDVTFPSILSEGEMEFQLKGYFHQPDPYFPEELVEVKNYEARLKFEAKKRSWSIKKFIIVHGPTEGYNKNGVFYVDKELFKSLPGSSSNQ